LLFLLYGTILGTWTARIPAVKHRLALTDGQLSLALLAFAAGAIAGMQASGRLVDRYGSTKVMIPAVLADGVLLVGPSLAPDLPVLAVSLFVFGTVHGTLNVAMNVNAVEVQRIRDRPMISSCHAVYSVGGFAGAGIGGLFASAALGPTPTFLTVTALVAVLSVWSARWALPHGAARSPADGAGSDTPSPVDRGVEPAGGVLEPGAAGLTEATASGPLPHEPATLVPPTPAAAAAASGPAAPLSVTPAPAASGAAELGAVPAATPPASAPPASAPPGGAEAMRGVLFLGLLVFCCLVGEGAAADWGSVYLRDSLHSSPGFAAWAYAAFSVAMMAGRLVGDRLAARLGPVALVRVSGALAAAGLAAGLAVDRPVAGVVGFGLLGAGLSCIAPQVFSSAGNRNPTRAGQAIARVAGLGFLGFVVGPVVIGGTAQLIGLPRALGIPAVLALAVAAAAPALRPRPTG
jgi:predicted MFS family arabinose efflux permease